MLKGLIQSNSELERALSIALIINFLSINKITSDQKDNCESIDNKLE